MCTLHTPFCDGLKNTQRSLFPLFADGPNNAIGIKRLADFKAAPLILTMTVVAIDRRLVVATTALLYLLCVATNTSKVPLGCRQYKHCCDLLRCLNRFITESQCRC